MKQEKSQLKIGIILNYVNMFLGNLIPIFYTPIMLSLLGQSEYGLYKLSSSVTSYLSLISMGLGSAITRYLIKAREEEGKEAEERMLGLFLIVFNVVAVLSFVVGTVLTLNLHVWYSASLTSTELQRMKMLVFMMVCNMALSFSQSPYLSVVTAHEKFLFSQCMSIVITCIAPLLNLVALYLGAASVGMTIVTLVVTAVTRLVYQMYVRRNMELKPRFRNLPVHQFKEIMQFSFWIFVSNVVGQLYNATDTVMIGAIPALATTGVAIYSIGGTFNNIVFSLTTGISSLLAPKVNKLVFSGTSNFELTELAIRVGRLQGFVFALVVSGFAAFGLPFISFYVGKGYEESYWVAIFLMIPNMIPLVQSICLNVVVARNRHQFRSLVYLGIAILNVIGTWFLMQTIGVIGAALMTGISLVLGQGIVMNWYYHRKTGLDMVRFWRETGKIYLIPVMMCIVTLLLSKWINFYNRMVLFAGIIIYTCVYLVLCWHFSMTGYEKDLLLVPFLKLKTH